MVANPLIISNRVKLISEPFTQHRVENMEFWEQEQTVVNLVRKFNKNPRAFRKAFQKMPHEDRKALLQALRVVEDWVTPLF